jgi:hypothetical protein
MSLFSKSLSNIIWGLKRGTVDTAQAVEVVDGMASVYIGGSGLTSIQPFNAVIFNAIAAGSIIGADHVEDHNDWGFDVTAINAADTIDIAPSATGGSTPAVGAGILLMNMATGAVVNSIVAVGFYKPVEKTATGYYRTIPVQTRAWGITKGGANGTATITAIGGWRSN